MNKVTKTIFTITLLTGVFIVTPMFSFSSDKKINKSLIKNSKAVSVLCDTCKLGRKGAAARLHTNMRTLWEEHILWTRNVILCMVDNLPGQDQALKRLLQNQVDIGNAIKPYYGEEAGKKLSELLTAHIVISADVIKAAKASNASALDLANKKWNANADEISEFLSKANPNLPLAEMKKMMYDHLKLTTDEVVQRIKKDYDADVIAYGKVQEEILKMSDEIAAAIIKQFPKKFTK